MSIRPELPRDRGRVDPYEWATASPNAKAVCQHSCGRAGVARLRHQQHGTSAFGGYTLQWEGEGVGRVGR